MPSSKNIQDIKTNLLHPALTSFFEVEIPKPSGLTGRYLAQNGITNFNQSKLNLLCSEAVLPGSQLATHDITGDYHGSTHRHAYRRQFDDTLALTFYVDAENYLPIRYFETWIKYTAGEQIASQPSEADIKNGEKGRPGVADRQYFYRMNYPTSYICNEGLKVTKFERSHGSGTKDAQQRELTYQFVNCFPTSINSMAVSYDTSSLLKCSVSLSYVRYFIDPKGSTEQAEPRADANTSAFNTPLTAQQQAAVNAAYTQKSDLGLNIPPITTGGFPTSTANSSGNSLSVQDAYSGNFILNR